MSTDFEKSLLEEFECPICFDYMHPPIRECRSGHSFCSGCFRKFKICPLCQTKKKKFSARNYVMEDIHAKLTFPCKYDKCTYRGLGKDIKSHQDACDIGLTSCPMNPLYPCSWKGDRKDLETHLLKRHCNQFSVDDEKYIIIEDLKDILTKTEYSILSAYNALFRIIYEIGYPDDEEEQCKWAVHYLGTEEDAKKRDFFYKIEFLESFENRNSPTSLIYQSKVPVEKEFNFDVENPKTFMKNHHFAVHRELLNEYCPLGDLRVAITIYDNGKNH